MQISANSSSTSGGGGVGTTSHSTKGSSAADLAADLNGSGQQNWPGCFRHVARCRRLNKEEVVLILTDPAKFGLVRTEVLPAEGIASGTVYLCSKDRVRVLKHDGIDYVKRNAAQGSNRIREDVVKMKVNGRHAVNSYSSRGSGSACFWRRRYALEPPAPANGSGTGSRGRGGQHTVTWGDQLVHYLDDEEARGFARRSPFGAAGVARPLTSEECWRGRGAQLPPDGNLFLPVSTRESSSAAAAARRLEEQHHLAAHAHAHAPVVLPSSASASDKPLPSLSASVVKQEDSSPYRGGGNWGGGGNSGSKASQGNSRRYSTGGDVRAIIPAVWGAATDVYGMSGNGNGNSHGDAGGMGVVPSGRMGAGGMVGGGGGGGMPMWEVRKSMEAQQAAGLTNPTGFYDDDIGGLEFEGLGMGDVGQGTNGSTDDDMSDLFRSFLVDGEDLLAVTGGSAGNSHHSGGSGGNHSGGNHPGGAPVEHASPAGFGLRVGSGGGRGGRGGGGGGMHDADMMSRRRANTSPEIDEMGGGSVGPSQRLMDMPIRPLSPMSQRSPMVMLPALVGSPPRRAEPHSNTNNSKHNNINKNTGGGINSPASRFVPSSHGHGCHGGPGGHMGGKKVSAAVVAAAAAAVTAAGGGGGAAGEANGPPASLQLASPWNGDSYTSAPSMPTNVTSSSPRDGLHDNSGGVMHAAPSPAGTLQGLSGGGVTIVDFSPTWDFASGGAKLLICLATPLDLDPGTAGPIVFFADRPVQSEVVTPTVLRCRVPPGPGQDGTGRVAIRVETSHALGSHGSMSRLESPAADLAGSSAGGRNHGAMAGVQVFEYRSPANSPSSAACTISRGGTPRVSTPGKKLSWQELPEDKSAAAATRKRDWGEVATSSAPSPLEPIHSSPNVCNWAERGRGWGTPRASEPTSWVTVNGRGGGGGRGSQSASGARRAQPHPWRRASGDFGQTALAASRCADALPQSHEDSLGYPLLPCDGRECKIRIVERLGEIQGSRASSAPSDTHGEAGGRFSLSSISSGGGCEGNTLGALASGNTDLNGDANQISDLSTSGGLGSTFSLSGRLGLGVAREDGNGHDIGHHQALDDTALNDLGDAELEVLLEQMWMKVMGQLTDLESELNALDTRGFSVLHYTCLHNLGALVPVLLDRGAHVNLRTGDGRDQTPLHLAALAGNLSIVKVLIKKRADVHAIDADGLTPDKLAIRCNKREVGLYLWGEARNSSGPAGDPSSSSAHNANANNNTTASSATTTTTTARQDSPAPVLPWGGGVSPAGCPPSPWSGSAGGADNWQGQLSPSPETPTEHMMSSSTPRGNASPALSSRSHTGENISISNHGAGVGPSWAAAAAAADTTPTGMAGLNGSGGGRGSSSPSFIGQVPGAWNASAGSSSHGAAGPGTAGSRSPDIDGGVRMPGGDSGSGEWGMGLPPPGGGRGAAARAAEADRDAPPSLDRLEMVAMDEANGGGREGVEDCDGSTGSGSSGSGKSASTEQLLAEAFSTLSLHEKCALSLHVSSLQQQGGQQQRGAGAGSPHAAGMDYSELSGVSNVLSGDEGGLRANDLQAIISMMGPSDLSDIEDEVKVIQQNVRAWILRCNYKSLRKAARTLQVAWRERQKARVSEAGSVSTPGGASASPLSAHPPSPARSIPRLPSNLVLNSSSSNNNNINGPEPMDDGSNDYMNRINSGADDVSGGETPPRSSDAAGSDAGGGGGGVGGGGGGGGGSVSLNLAGADGEKSTREERAAKALQTAARVMLARRSRFQRLATETRSLLVIQKRSREWLKNKQN